MQGITVLLTEKLEIEKDPFGESVFEETQTEIENVLVAPASSEDIMNGLSIHGKRIAYNLAIPKGDTHNWEDTVVEFWGRKFRTIGIPKEGIEDLIPLSWNRQISVECYERI